MKFRVSDYTKSQTAQRKGIDNSVPNQLILRRLISLHTNIVGKILCGFPDVVINSGYRCPKLNKAIGSSSKSQHTKGQAVDLEVPGVSNFKLWQWCKKNLDYDQLILEFYKKGQPSSGWVHISYVSPEENRRQAFKI